MEFTLRPWTLDDLASLVRFADNPAIAGNLTDAFPHPYTEESGRRFIGMANGHTPPLVLAIEVNGEAAGGIGLHPQADVYRRNAELGYWLAEPYWGKGIMTRAIAEMLAYGWQVLPEIVRVYARPFGSNLGSQRALEKAGFVLEARMSGVFYKNGVFEDELIYAVRRRQA